MYCRFFEEAFQDAGAAMVLVVCRMDERQHTFQALRMQEFNRFTLPLEFRSIRLLKLPPLIDVWVLAEPLVQFITRGDLLEPLIKLRVLLR
jgi:hypothetical protein